MYTIGIAGGTCSGKTTLSGKLDGMFTAAGYKTCVIHMDSFFKKVTPTVVAPFTGVEYPEHNHPDSFRMDEFYAAVDEAQASDADVLIIEGLLILYLERIREKLDLKIFVDLLSDERMYRRIHKFMAMRGDTLEQVCDRYLDTVRWRHAEFVEPSRWYADLVINGADKDGLAAEAVLALAEKKMGK